MMLSHYNSDSTSSDNTCLVKECHELEEGFGTSFTDELLSGADSVVLREVREVIRKIDREIMLEKCMQKSKFIVEVGKEVGWSCGIVSWTWGPSMSGDCRI